MKLRSIALGSVASAALFAGGAIAADLPVRAPAPAPVFVAPIFSWTGFYAGVHAGYANTKNRSSFDYEATQPGGAFANGTCANWSNPAASNNSAAANPCYPYPLFVPSPNTDTSLAGNEASLATALAAGALPTRVGGGSDGVFTGGVQLGYNYQMGSFVIGVEADWSYLGADKRQDWEGEYRLFNRGVNYNGTGFVSYNNELSSAFATASSGVDWLATARLRAGFTVDRFLIFATGGLAFGEVKNSGRIDVIDNRTDGDEINAFWSGRGSKTQTGWALGGGVEWAFANNWSFKAEYLHYDLGDTSYTLVGNGAVGGGGREARDGADYAIKIRGKSENTGDIFRVGLNYRFGAPAPAPVIARY